MSAELLGFNKTLLMFQSQFYRFISMGSSSWGTIPFASLLKKLIFGVEVDLSKGDSLSICITCLACFFLGELDSSPLVKPLTIVFIMLHGRLGLCPSSIF